MPAIGLGSSERVLVQRETEFLLQRVEQCGGIVPAVQASCQKGFSHCRKIEVKMTMKCTLIGIDDQHRAVQHLPFQCSDSVSDGVMEPEKNEPLPADPLTESDGTADHLDRQKAELEDEML